MTAGHGLGVLFETSNALFKTSKWFSAAPCPPHLEIPLRLTAIALLLRPMGPWFVRPAILAAAAIVLISPRALRTPAVWAGVAMLVAVRIADDWPLADNHIYLLAYWGLAIALALRATDISHALSTASRWLLGLAFAFAVLWKVLLSPDYLDGRFFRVTLLTDPRFGEAAMLIGTICRRARGESSRPRPAARRRRAGDASRRDRASAAEGSCDCLDVGHGAARGARGRLDAGLSATNSGRTSSQPAAQFLRDHVHLCAGRWLRLACPRDGCSRNSRGRCLGSPRLRRRFPRCPLLFRSPLGRPSARRLSRMSYSHVAGGRVRLTTSREHRGQIEALWTLCRRFEGPPARHHL